MKTILYIFLLSSLFSCQNKPTTSIEEDKKAILALDKQTRELHFNKDAKTLVNGFSKDFLSINKGRVELPSVDESFQKFSIYFKRVNFVKWDNNKEPLIRFSDDATIAYAAFDKTVILKLTDENGKEIMDTTGFAWLSVYKKSEGQWKLDCIASTNK